MMVENWLFDPLATRLLNGMVPNPDHNGNINLILNFYERKKSDFRLLLHSKKNLLIL
jgi:hypothetical protein